MCCVEVANASYRRLIGCRQKSDSLFLSVFLGAGEQKTAKGVAVDGQPFLARPLVLAWSTPSPDAHEYIHVELIIEWFEWSD
jgi:hypothetical protein